MHAALISLQSVQPPLWCSARWGCSEGRYATCYPGTESGMQGAKPQAVPCVQDGHILTGRGAGAAFAMGLKMCEVLCGKQKADEIAAAVCYAQ